MLRIFLTLALLTCACRDFTPTLCTAGETSKKTGDEMIEFDSYPSPVGGFEVFLSNIKYPKSGLKSGTQGRVLVTISFDEKGSITKTEIVESLGSEFDKAAVEAVLKTKWTPAVAKGQPAACQVNIPIQFALKDKKK
jgi:TonB family protein